MMLIRCWVCEKGEIVHVRRKEPTCSECGQYFMDGEMAAYEAGQRWLVEEVARWLRETFPNGAGPADAQSAVSSQHAREYLATLLQRRFGTPEEKPEGQG